jgi:hypothetical protein
MEQLLEDRGGSLVFQRLAVTAFLGAWPWSIALFLPLALLLFPTGGCRALAGVRSRGWSC